MAFELITTTTKKTFDVLILPMASKKITTSKIKISTTYGVLPMDTKACGGLGQGQLGQINRLGEDRGLLHAGQDLDVVGHPAYLLPTPRQYLSSEHKSDAITFKLPPILAGIIFSNHFTMK